MLFFVYLPISVLPTARAVVHEFFPNLTRIMRLSDREGAISYFLWFICIRLYCIKW